MVIRCASCNERYLVSVCYDRNQDSSGGLCLPCQEAFFRGTPAGRMRELREKLLYIQERRAAGTLPSWVENEKYLAVTWLEYFLEGIPPF